MVNLIALIGLILAEAFMTAMSGCYKENVQKFKVAIYRLDATLGDVRAQINLGHCLGRAYYTGEGVAQDKQEAFKWYRKAAECGDAEAQNIIGTM